MRTKIHRNFAWPFWKGTMLLLLTLSSSVSGEETIPNLSVHAQFIQGSGGAVRTGTFFGGEKCFIQIKIANAMMREPDGMSLLMNVRVFKNSEQMPPSLAEQKYNLYGRPALGGASFVTEAILTLYDVFGAGDYTLEVTVEDRFAGTKAQTTNGLTLLDSQVFGIRNLVCAYAPPLDGKRIQPILDNALICRGNARLLSFGVGGFQVDSSDTASISNSVEFFDDRDQSLGKYVFPLYQNNVSKFFRDMPIEFSLKFWPNRCGQFYAIIHSKDSISGNKATATFPFIVTDDIGHSIPLDESATELLVEYSFTYGTNDGTRPPSFFSGQTCLGKLSILGLTKTEGNSVSFDLTIVVLKNTANKSEKVFSSHGTLNEQIFFDERVFVMTLSHLLSTDMAEGMYTWQALVTDNVSGKTAQKNLDFEVVKGQSSFGLSNVGFAYSPARLPPANQTTKIFSQSVFSLGSSIYLPFSIAGFQLDEDRNVNGDLTATFFDDNQNEVYKISDHIKTSIPSYYSPGFSIDKSTALAAIREGEYKIEIRCNDNISGKTFVKLIPFSIVDSSSLLSGVLVQEF